MAAGNTKRISSTRRNTTSRGRRQAGASRTKPMDNSIRNEIIIIGILAAAVFLFLCNFGIVGVVGDTVSDVMFGIFGLPAYITPVFLFILTAFGISNRGSFIAGRKIAAGVVLYLLIGMLCELAVAGLTAGAVYDLEEIYLRCAKEHAGGGITTGSLAFLSYHFLGMVGTVLVIVVLGIISLVVITERSFMRGVKSGSQRVYERSREDVALRRERNRLRREEQEEERRRLEEEAENEKILRMDKKITGVMMNTTLPREKGALSGPGGEQPVSAAAGLPGPGPGKVRNDIHEITLQDFEEQIDGIAVSRTDEFDFNKIRIHGIYDGSLAEEEGEGASSQELREIHISPAAGLEAKAGNETGGEPTGDTPGQISGWAEDNRSQRPARKPFLVEKEESAPEKAPLIPEPDFLPPAADSFRETAVVPDNNPDRELAGEMNKAALKVPKKYIFPPLSKLKAVSAKGRGDHTRELKETALRLQQTLQTFGVGVNITDISQGPAVTRYELQPEQGVKVSKIVSLADDIKLNLAATDIRIEAPIPGKAAVGIEVPNKENTAVAFRELVETKEFKDFPSDLTFAVGKDIAGKIVVSDIARMPHMLIAGATGSGKSVCINTLIMSILYKAHPENVKLIMIDPKVVELSVYNGIPHLLIPVVTDPRKASAALHWGVAEMTDRYQKFADYNVRDLKGYNKKVEGMRADGDPEAPEKLPQIVIIVDELADLMMVSPGEVEESICRLAQLARAAGIHLIIATQRPSVDVITGLIKANMPSRVAFSVSSGVDSRTILDMNGAEKLLGKGDMLFYPQGYSKPARVQGAFISDKEVSDVVDFLKSQTAGNSYSEDVEEKITHLGVTGGGGQAGEGGGERDSYFIEAGKFIIDKEKASIGNLQRVFKIGFNRAARIMDQLCDAGVVGEEEGTKPRKVLMSQEEFEQYIEEFY